MKKAGGSSQAQKRGPGTGSQTGTPGPCDPRLASPTLCKPSSLSASPHRRTKRSGKTTGVHEFRRLAQGPGSRNTDFNPKSQNYRKLRLFRHRKAATIVICGVFRRRDAETIVFCGVFAMLVVMHSRSKSRNYRNLRCCRNVFTIETSNSM